MRQFPPLQPVFVTILPSDLTNDDDDDDQGNDNDEDADEDADNDNGNGNSSKKGKKRARGIDGKPTPEIVIQKVGGPLEGPLVVLYMIVYEIVYQLQCFRVPSRREPLASSHRDLRTRDSSHNSRHGEIFEGPRRSRCDLRIKCPRPIYYDQIKRFAFIWAL